MGDLLEALHRLQTVELQLAELRKSQESKKGRVEAHKRQLKKLDDKLAEYHTARFEHQKRADLLSLDDKSREESIDKHREALTRARTNREYASILTALNTEKADKSKLEMEIVDLLDKVKAIEDQEAAVRTERQQLLQRMQTAEAALAEHLRDIAERRSALQAERDAIAHDIPPTTLDTFNRVADHHEGEALVPVIQIHPKKQEYTCSGCNMKIALEVINTLQIGSEVQFCSVCGRILFFEQAMQRH